MQRALQSPVTNDVSLAPRWSLAPFLIFGWAIALLAAVPAAASDVVIVRTSDAEPYVQAEAALQNQLMLGHNTVRSLLAKELFDKGIEAGIGKTDAVVAIGTPASRWLQKQLPPNIQLIYCMVSNAADAGLLEGRDCTGVTTDVAITEQIDLIAEALPKARSVGVIYRSDTAEGRAVLNMLERAMPANWAVRAIAVNDFPSIAAAITSLIEKHVDIIWTTADQKLFDTASVRTLLLSALRAKIPVWGFSPAFVRAGALLGVGVEPAAQGKQAAKLVVESIDGRLPAQQRAVPPEQFQIAVNLIVAKQLELEVPESLTRRAAFVFQPEK